MRAFTRAAVLACVSLAFSIGGRAPLALAAGAGNGRAPFDLYCAGCHALGDGGGRQGVPDLSGLSAKYGTPLPRAHLVDFVTDDHRLGGPRICGERVFGKLPATPFRESVERATVRDALDFVEAAQRVK